MDGGMEGWNVRAHSSGSLTRLHVGDGAPLVEGAGEKPTPAGGPAGVTHGSPVAGVAPEAAAALHGVPHLPPAHKTRQGQSCVESP